MDKMNIYDMVGKAGISCDCGVEHNCFLDYLLIEKGAINHVCDMVHALNAVYVYVVCDKNTYKAAGEKVCRLLEDGSIRYKLHIVPGERPAPSEFEVGSAIMGMDPACDLVLAVGGGVINDICKVIAYASGKANAIVGTAPSMDGFASSSSSMEFNHVKVTLYNQHPGGILLDSEIMAQAPMRMLWAGFGDMMAKYTAVCEWKISHIINGEYYCDYVAEIMRTAIRKIRAQEENIPKRDPEAVQAIAEGLMLAGIAMSFAKVSRPASGLEHYFSHMWEMMALDRNRPYDLHGIQVAVGTLLDVKLLNSLKNEIPDKEKALAKVAAFDNNKWTAEVKRIFGKSAEGIIAMEEKFKKNDPVKHAKRLDTIIEKWDEIKKIIEEEVPSYEELYDCMKKLGMPLLPEDIGISRQDTVDAFWGSREIRDKYVTSTLIWDLGLTEEYAEKL